MNIKTAFGAALVLSAASASISPAFAGDTMETQTAAVVYRDLDLSSEGGRDELDRRIDTAAKTVCGDGRVTGTRIQSRGARKCVTDAKAQLNKRFAQIVQNASKGG